MDEAEARAIFERFLSGKEAAVGIPLAAVPGQARRVSEGWAFFFQSRSYVETRDITDMLVGQGPVIVLDDGAILEGGSLDVDPEQVLIRRSERPRGTGRVASDDHDPLGDPNHQPASHRATGDPA